MTEVMYLQDGGKLEILRNSGDHVQPVAERGDPPVHVGRFLRTVRSPAFC